MGPMSSQQEQPIVQREIEQQISSLLLSESFSIVGTEVDTGRQIITAFSIARTDYMNCADQISQCVRS